MCVCGGGGVRRWGGSLRRLAQIVLSRSNRRLSVFVLFEKESCYGHSTSSFDCLTLTLTQIKSSRRP